MATPRSVAFYTLGCKLNYSETSSISRMFEDNGFAISRFEEGADYYVINTCSVTDFADRKCRQVVRKARKISPHARIIMTGCYAQLKPEEIAGIKGVDLVLGAGEKFKILDYIQQLHEGDMDPVQVSPVREIRSFEEAFSYGDRTRSFLKVQDGCDYNCAFCTIPLARGKSRSNTIEKIVREARRIARLGVKEIVLTGVNIGDFGKYHDDRTDKFRRKTGFYELLVALDEVEDVRRFRISSIEPNLCHDQIIEFVSGSEKFVPHFHMPLQSGSDKILASMQRRYRTELYRNRVECIRNRMPDACIGVDVIVGFPGETEEDFLETYRFIQELPVCYLHVFTYSERNRTQATNLPGVVPMEERRRRNKMLTILSEKKKRAFYASFEGECRRVLFERSRDPLYMTGFTDNYLKVNVPFQEKWINEFAWVNLHPLGKDIVFPASLSVPGHVLS